MRSVLAVIASAIVLSGVAHAQGPAAEKGYVEGVAQSAFGNVTTQSYGVEFGATFRYSASSERSRASRAARSRATRTRSPAR